MISDASGETVESIGKAMIAQFEGQLQITGHIWPMIRSKSSVDLIFQSMKQKPGVILYTILEQDLRDYLIKKSEDAGLFHISVLEKITNDIANFMDVEVRNDGIPGKYKILDDNYYKRIEVLNFTMQHDDGIDSKNYNNADILILGVSRTSKSPTSLYLAQRGYKVANMPIIDKVRVDLSKVVKPLIIGLTIAPDILYQIRSSRLLSYNVNIANNVENSYTDYDAIKDELRYAMRLFNQYSIPIIDVSRKAVEEVSAEIMRLYYIKKGELKR